MNIIDLPKKYRRILQLNIQIFYTVYTSLPLM